MAEKQTHPLDAHTRGKETRSASMRKLAADGPSWTPTEQLQRNKLMRQFSKRAKGYAVSISEEFRSNYDLIDWTKT